MIGGNYAATGVAFPNGAPNRRLGFSKADGRIWRLWVYFVEKLGSS
jgi:hypothetical protein